MKFQYIRNFDYRNNQYKNDLCISIVSMIDVEKSTNSTIVLNWSACFKHPKDQFSKQMARDILFDENNTPPFYKIELVIPRKDFKAHVIKDKIMKYLCYHEHKLLPHYREFVYGYAD